MKFYSILITSLLPAFQILFSSNNTYAQDTASESSFYDKALVNAMAVYHHSFEKKSALYNGSKYGDYPFAFKEGHPFFDSTLMVAGSVVYDGIMYDAVLMSYDEIADVLVINNGYEKIQLLSEKVEYFNLFNSDFIRLVKDSGTIGLVSTGFYNLLYKGKISLLKKQVKTIREVIASNSEIEHFADEKDHYYIKKDAVIYPISKRKNLFKLFGDRKEEVQQFIKANRLSFKKDRQDMLTKATAYYDSLKK